MLAKSIISVPYFCPDVFVAVDGDERLTNYRDKAYNFIEVFQVKDKFKRHLINGC